MSSLRTWSNARESEWLELYREHGFVALGGLLSADEVAEARLRLADLSRQAGQDAESYVFEPGHDDGTVVNAPRIRARTGRFFVQLEPGTSLEPGVEPVVRKLMDYCEVDAVLDTLSGPGSAIGTIVSSLLGGGVQRFQDMALVKPAHCGGEKPWHQDCAYFDVLPLRAVIGVWIALDDATVENGCMHVVPGAHLEGPRRHRIASDCELEAGVDPARVKAIELPAGGALLFSGLLPHWTPGNRSPHPRRALQFHYRRTDSRRASADEYDQVFVDDTGRPASCAAATRRPGAPR